MCGTDERGINDKLKREGAGISSQLLRISASDIQQMCVQAHMAKARLCVSARVQVLK